MQPFGLREFVQVSQDSAHVGLPSALDGLWLASHRTGFAASVTLSRRACEPCETASRLKEFFVAASPAQSQRTTGRSVDDRYLARLGIAAAKQPHEIGKVGKPTTLG